MKLNNIKILYVLNVLFFCALVGVSAYALPKLQQRPLANQTTGGLPMYTSTTTEAVANITVGGNSNDPAATKLGTVTQINGATLAIKDPATGQAYTVTTNADTKVQIEGALKEQKAYQKELDAYYAQIKLLMQDPAKNKAALGVLILPDPAESKFGTLTDLVVGDNLVFQATAPISGASFTAARIIKPQQVAK